MSKTLFYMLLLSLFTVATTYHHYRLKHAYLDGYKEALEYRLAVIREKLNVPKSEGK